MVFVIIPNWNGRDLIQKCLQALARQTQPHRVIVVDNGSVDGSDMLVEQEFPQVELKRFPDNAGFAGGVNRGIRPALKAGADYIALLNNDAVPEPDWLKRLVQAVEADPRAGIVTSKITAQGGRALDSTGDFYSIWGLPFPRGRGEADAGQYDGSDLRDVFAASGGASLYRAQMLREIGLFDERFFAYYEDVDLSFRARLAGWKVLYEPRAVVCHAISGTSSRIKRNGTALEPDAAVTHKDTALPSAFTRFHTVKNYVYLYTKNMPGWLYWKYLPRFMGGWVLMFVNDLGRGLLLPNIQGTSVALIHLPGVLADRWRIQRRRKVRATEIDCQLVHSLPPLQQARLRRLLSGGRNVQ
jgi:GT2 family glycosyltransferase